MPFLDIPTSTPIITQINNLSFENVSTVVYKNKVPSTVDEIICKEVVDEYTNNVSNFSLNTNTQCDEENMWVLSTVVIIFQLAPITNLIKKKQCTINVEKIILLFQNH